MNFLAEAFKKHSFSHLRHLIPPLILHPFSGPEDTSVLMESSRASLALQGFLPHSELTEETLDQQLLRRPVCRTSMLFSSVRSPSR